MNANHKFLRRILAAAAILLLCGLTGCAGDRRVVTGSEPVPAVPPSHYRPPTPAAAAAASEDGASLWRDDGLFSDLFVLPKARGIGDVVTIKIVESSSATNKANTLTERESSLTAKIDAFLGLEKRYLDATHPGFRADRNFNPFGTIQGGMTSKFDGNGTTSRSGDLTAFITARVTGVTSNGNLRIEGTREVEVNNEKQFIMLSGTIRPRDIAPDNIILSTYISDARITYSGAGVIDDRQRPGWMANLLNSIWPF